MQIHALYGFIRFEYPPLVLHAKARVIQTITAPQIAPNKTLTAFGSSQTKVKGRHEGSFIARFEVVFAEIIAIKTNAKTDGRVERKR